MLRSHCVYRLVQGAILCDPRLLAQQNYLQVYLHLTGDEDLASAARNGRRGKDNSAGLAIESCSLQIRLTRSRIRGYLARLTGPSEGERPGSNGRSPTPSPP